MREKLGLGEIKPEPVSGTLGRNWRSSEVNEPTGEFSAFCVCVEANDLQILKGGLPVPVGKVTQGDKDQKMIISGYQVKYHSFETPTGCSVASKRTRI